MIHKQTGIAAGDHSGIRGSKVTHLYRGFNRKCSPAGYFVRIAVQVTYPPRVEYKGFKYKPLRKGHVTRALIIRTSKETLYSDGSTVSFFENAGSLIKKKKLPRTIHVIGPVSRKLKRKTFLALFEHQI